MKGWITLLILAGLCVGVFSLGSLQRETDGKNMLNVAEEVGLTVNITKPSEGAIVRIVQAPGDVEAVLEVEISSEIVSRIDEMPVEEGDTVSLHLTNLERAEDDLTARLAAAPDPTPATFLPESGAFSGSEPSPCSRW